MRFRSFGNRKPNTEPEERSVIITLKNNQKGKIVWTYITTSSTVNLIVIEKNMAEYLYVTILKTNYH